MIYPFLTKTSNQFTSNEYSIFFFLLFIKILLAYHVVLVLGVQHRDSTFIYLMMCSPQIYYPSVTGQNYYVIIGSISYAVCYIPRSYLFYYWKLSLLFPFTFFSHCPIFPPQLQKSSQFVL